MGFGIFYNSKFLYNKKLGSYLKDKGNFPSSRYDRISMYDRKCFVYYEVNCASFDYESLFSRAYYIFL